MAAGIEWVGQPVKSEAIYQNITLTPGANYRLKFRYKLGNMNNPGATLRVSITNQSFSCAAFSQNTPQDLGLQPIPNLTAPIWSTSILLPQYPDLTYYDDFEQVISIPSNLTGNYKLLFYAEYNPPPPHVWVQLSSINIAKVQLIPELLPTVQITPSNPPISCPGPEFPVSFIATAAPSSSTFTYL